MFLAVMHIYQIPHFLQEKNIKECPREKNSKECPQEKDSKECPQEKDSKECPQEKDSKECPVCGQHIPNNIFSAHVSQCEHEKADTEVCSVIHNTIIAPPPDPFVNLL